MPRVLIFSTAYLPHVGGAEIAIAELTKRLPSYQFELVCARMDAKLPTQEVMGNVLVHRLGIGVRIVDKLLIPWLGALFAVTRRYDLYWAMMATYGSGGAYIARWFTRTPVVLTLQEGDPPAYLRRKWFGMVALSWRLALSQTTVLTVISTYLGELATEFGYRGTPVVIPNGVAIEHFNVAKVPHEGTVLVTTSRLVHKNAVDDVIRALALLPASVSFHIYGTGPDEGMLRTLAKQLNVADRVRFMGHLAYEKLPGALAAADIFIRPSRSEGMGNSFIEAMAASLPVIGTQEGGIKDFLFDAKRNSDKDATGFAVAPDSPEEIAAMVAYITEHPEEVRATTANAHAYIQGRYEWGALAGRMQDVFDKVN